MIVFNPDKPVFIQILCKQKDQFLHCISQDKDKFVYEVKTGIIGAAIWHKINALKFLKEEGITNYKLIDAVKIIKKQQPS